MLVIKAVLVLCSAVAVMAETASLVSGAAFVGVDTTNPDATPLQIFEDPANHATAQSSVIGYAAKSADFLPFLVPPKSLGTNFNNYVTKISTFPGFMLQFNEQSSFEIDGSLIQLEKLIREASLDHGELIGRSMRDLIPGYIPDKEMTEWILSFALMEKPAGSNEVTLQLYYLTLTIETDEDHTAYIPKQNVFLNRSQYRVIGSFLASNAQKLADMIPITSVDAIIKLLTSPKVIPEGSAATCHRDSSSSGRRQALFSWTK